MKKIFEYRRDESREYLNCDDIPFEDAISCCLRPVALFYTRLKKSNPELAEMVRGMVIMAVLDPKSPVFNDYLSGDVKQEIDICVVTPKRDKGESGK